MHDNAAEARVHFDKMKKFSRKTTLHLKHYVYLLVDPRTEEALYVGKGSGASRPFSHFIDDAQKFSRERPSRISELMGAGIEPRVDVLRHGIDATTAHEIEAAVIDAFGVENLDNKNTGHHSPNRGRLTADQVEGKFGGQPLDVESIRQPSILFYRREAYPADRLYDETRQFWDLSEKRIRARNENGELKYQLAFAMRGNFVLEVYRILAWFEAGTTVSSRTYAPVDDRRRWEFVASIADKAVRDRYRNRSILRNGAPLHATQIGFRYIN